MSRDRNQELFNLFNNANNLDENCGNRRAERFEARGFIRDEDGDDVDPIEIQGTIFRRVREKKEEKCCCQRPCCCECRPCCHNDRR